MAKAIDPTALREAAQREVDQGLQACQLAVGFEDRVVWTESFGSADPETRFRVASATKPIVASAIWLLVGDGRIDIQQPVAHYIPEFGANGKQTVTVEQVLLMTSGFPDAPMDPAEGADPERRIARMADWTLEHPPGTKYVYHPGSAHWVLAELIERQGGLDFRDFIEERITKPLGLPRVLGIPRGQQENLETLALPSGHMDTDQAGMIEAGVPGGGGAMTAATLARFYQALLHNPGDLWEKDVLEDATTHVRCTLPDPLMNLPANRTLGVVVGAGFGTTWGNSSTAFGWPGAGGQIGFAEPATGISFAFLQAGDPEEMSQFVRAIQLSNLALELGR